MRTGRFSPGYGRGRGALKAILESLNARRGAALDTSLDGIVYAENEAIARMLWIAWEQNQRFANQFDPLRMTDMLPRWERIFGLAPLNAGMTLVARRAAVADRWARLGMVAIDARIEDRLRAVLGNIFVAVEWIPVDLATQWWPGGTPNPDAPWYSTTAHLRVRVARPSNASLGEFWERLGRMNPVLDDLLSSTLTWDWYTVSSTGSGFYLDEPNNLDHYAFD